MSSLLLKAQAGLIDAHANLVASQEFLNELRKSFIEKFEWIIVPEQGRPKHLPCVDCNKPIKTGEIVLGAIDFQGVGAYTHKHCVLAGMPASTPELILKAYEETGDMFAAEER